MSVVICSLGCMSIADSFERLRADELAAVGRRGVFTRLAELDAQIAALQAERVQLLGRVGDEALLQAELNVELLPSRDPDRERNLQWRSAALELAASANVGTDAAQRQLAEAWTLTQKCQVTLEALAAGQITFGHAQAIAREIEGLDPIAAGQAQEVLLPYAQRLSVGLFTRKARQVLDVRDPECLADRHARAYARRSITVDGARDGMATLTAYLDAGDAAMIRTGLHNAARDARRAGDERTTRQLEADLFVEIVMGGQVTIGNADDSGDVETQTLADKAPVTVELLIPAATAAGNDAAPGKILGVGMIDPGAARRLLAKAPSLKRVLTDPVSSTIVDFDRKTYRVPAELKRMIRLRDEHCRAPNCSRPIADFDHTLEYARGGTTSKWNLSGLCENHHYVKHEADWSLLQYADGVLDWISPNARHYLTKPEPILPVEPPPAWDDYADDAPFDLPVKSEG
jgi:hypothetical protein